MHLIFTLIAYMKKQNKQNLPLFNDEVVEDGDELCSKLDCFGGVEVLLYFKGELCFLSFSVLHILLDSVSV